MKAPRGPTALKGRNAAVSGRVQQRGSMAAKADYRSVASGRERLRHSADLGGDRFDGRPLREVLASVLLHHAHRTFADLRGKLVRFGRGSILSEWWASTKYGAVQGCVLVVRLA